MRKVYVKVKAEFDTAGFLSPLSLTWEDGREFPIDPVHRAHPGQGAVSVV